MKITDINSRPIKPAEQEKKTLAKTPADKQNDAGETLEISPAAGRIRTLAARAMESPDNTEKVAALKKRINSGDYVLDSCRLARKMLLGQDD